MEWEYLCDPLRDEAGRERKLQQVLCYGARDGTVELRKEEGEMKLCI